MATPKRMVTCFPKVAAQKKAMAKPKGACRVNKAVNVIEADPPLFKRHKMLVNY